MFGYTSQPELIVFLTWLGYLVIVLPLYLRPVRPAEATQPTDQVVPEG
jgi:high-affinity Fe2+/Pb2+ permease